MFRHAGISLRLHIWIWQAKDVRQCRQPRAFKPVSEIAPLVETEYCETMLPTSNVFAPASETDSEMGAPGWTELSRSAQRPPQPVVGGWSGIEVCHWVTWSACEKSCGGLGFDPARYWERVMG